MIFQEKENRGVVSFATFMAFILLMFAVKLPAQWLLNIDHAIQNVTTISANSFLAKVFESLTFFGSPAVVLAFSAVLIGYFVFRREKVTALWIAFTILGGDAVAFIFKELVQRSRPSNIIGGDTGYSFPSGHVFGTTLLVLFTIYILAPRIKSSENKFVVTMLMWLWLFVVATSRIYLRSHYPSDVVWSLLLASSWWGCSQILYLKFYDTADRVLSRAHARRKAS